MAHLFQAPNALGLVDQISHALVYNQHPEAELLGPDGLRLPQVDMAAVTDTHILNVIGEVESFDWDFDLKDAWILRQRFSTLARQYLNPDGLKSWTDLIEGRLKKRNRGTALMRFNTVAERGSARRKSRRWGACMLGISFRRVPWPQITLYSRTSYFGYIAYLDMSLAHLLAKECSKITGIPVEEMRFVWHIEDAQWSWKSKAWLFQDEKRTADLWRFRDEIAAEGDTDKLWDQHPGMYVSAVWFDRFLQDDEEGVKYGDMSWAACSRVRRRYHTEILGYDYGAPFEGGTRLGHPNRYKPMPSCNVNTLTLDPIYGRNKNALPFEVGDALAEITHDECLCEGYLDEDGAALGSTSVEWRDEL